MENKKSKENNYNTLKAWGFFKQLEAIPTHDFEVLKKIRLERWENKEKKLKKIETSDFEIKCNYIDWLKGELKVIESLLSDSHPNGEKKLRPPTTVEQIEITKYNQFVNDEILKTEKEIDPPQQTETKTEQENISARFYALYHWILIEMGKETPFEKNENDKYDKNTIENFGQNRYKCSKQGFYRNFINIDITKKTSIPQSFGKEYKQKLITISNNDSNVIAHLKKYPK